MRCGDIEVSARRCLVTWPHCKGGKVMRDILAQEVAAVLLDYLASVYPDGWHESDPVWVSTSNNHRGGAICTQAISAICLKRMGTGQVHSLRHTFAVLLEGEGAKLTDIQARLGHSNAATTSIYLQRLHGAESPHAAGIARKLGIGE